MNIMKNSGLILSIIAAGTISMRAEPAPPAPAIPAPGAPAVAPATGLPQAAPAVPATNTGGGKIQFEMPNYDFGKSKAGDPVKYTFVFTNVGTETLEIKNVRPGCGCTTAGEWTKKVEPGKTGTIPIQVNIAATWPNGPIAKYVDIDTSDASQPSTRLNIHGTIWKPVEVNPQIAMLNNVPVDAPEGASTTVTVTNNTDELIMLEAPESNSKNFAATLKTNVPGKGYQVTVKAVPPLTPGSAQGQITMKTSSTNVPTVSFTVYATMVAAVTVMPPQVTLPFAPISTKLTPSVTIQNNGANPIKVSDASVSSKDIAVQVNEIQPGKTFSATLTIPEGFEIAQGQTVELTLKSTHPQFPVIKVPITQMQKPPTPAIPQGVPIKPSAQIQPPVPPQVAH